MIFKKMRAVDDLLVILLSQNLKTGLFVSYSINYYQNAIYCQLLFYQLEKRYDRDTCRWLPDSTSAG